LFVFLRLTARFATLGSGITAFLKELLIGSGEGKFLPAIAACYLHVSGHRPPMCELYSRVPGIPIGILLNLQSLSWNPYSGTLNVLTV
jgi:hypothetical protein